MEDTVELRERFNLIEDTVQLKVRFSLLENTIQPWDRFNLLQDIPVSSGFDSNCYRGYITFSSRSQTAKGHNSAQRKD
jgi:hypothetical protein